MRTNPNGKWMNKKQRDVVKAPRKERNNYQTPKARQYVDCDQGWC
ncbi:hypothetical protein RZN25_09710 [Bacillaceae bacterium S4-13-56]